MKGNAGRKSILLLVFLLLQACIVYIPPARVPMATSAQDVEAKRFKVKPATASIYVYREGGLFANGQIYSFCVIVNDYLVGKTAEKTYFRLNVRPGKYVVYSDPGMHAKEYEKAKFIPVVLDVEAGKNYFIRQEISGVALVTARMLLEDEQSGRDAVLKSELIKTDMYQ